MATVNFTFPLWTIGTPGFSMRGVAHAIGEGGKIALFFTNELNGKEFLNSNKEFAGFVLRTIHDPVHFFGMLALLEKAGFYGCIVNHPPVPYGTNPTDTTGSDIAELREFIASRCV